MAFQVLIITPSSGFGKALQRFLEEMGVYHPMLINSVEEALELSQQVQFALAILDFCLGEYPLRKTAQSLREYSPDIRLLITSSQDKSDQPVMSELTAVGVFSEPFFLADLPKRVPEIAKSADKGTEPAISDEQAHEFPWLQDINIAAQHLASLSLSTAAQAALIVREGQLWAYAGQLPQSAASELTECVVNYWSPETNSDLVRFVKLTVNGGEHMLYATSLGGEMVLALTFDAKVPFSQIRTQANYLARGLVKPPGADVQEPQTSPRIGQLVDATPGKRPDKQAFGEPLFARDDVPPPTPGVSPSDQIDLTAGFSQREGEAPPEPTNELLETIGETASYAEPEPTRDLMPVSPSMYSLNYACMLIPRLPQHQLTGVFSERLATNVRRISIAYGWQLEYLAIRPDFLQWIVNMPPNVSPGYMMQVMREHTSQYIFDEFSRLAQENPSGDFWAPGYLLIGGQKMLPSHMVKNFIDRIRQSQDFPP